MQKEAAGLLEKMQDKTETVIGGVTYTAGTLCGHTAVVAVYSTWDSPRVSKAR